jgi:hypothetical protein
LHDMMQMYNEPEARFMKFNYRGDYDVSRIRTPVTVVSGGLQACIGLQTHFGWIMLGLQGETAVVQIRMALFVHKCMKIADAAAVAAARQQPR